MRWAKIIGYAALFLVLTIVSQVGGLALLLAIFINSRITQRWRGQDLMVFLLCYAVISFVITPVVAPYFGRQRIKNTDVIKPTSVVTRVLNRNYVVPEMNALLARTSRTLRGSGVEIRYLDANFPFVNGFPLLPHLSHNDGRKLDLSLVYQSPDGQLSNAKVSNSGYGVFAEPTKTEWNQTKECKSKGYWYYDYTKYLTLGEKNQELEYSNRYTRILLKALLKNKNLQKILIEPHLRSRLNIADSRIRFHGCHAVRHDDHIHIQI